MENKHLRTAASDRKFHDCYPNDLTKSSGWRKGRPTTLKYDLICICSPSGDQAYRCVRADDGVVENTIAPRLCMDVCDRFPEFKGTVYSCLLPPKFPICICSERGYSGLLGFSRLSLHTSRGLNSKHLYGFFQGGVLQGAWEGGRHAPLQAGRGLVGGGGAEGIGWVRGANKTEPLIFKRLGMQTFLLFAFNFPTKNSKDFANCFWEMICRSEKKDVGKIR